MTSRMMLTAPMRPVFGDRFQPTGFPDLGPAEYRTPEGHLGLVVESLPSMANRLEEVIWDPIRQDVIEPLKGMPYVRYQHPEHGLVTSLTEAHRAASNYLLPLIKDRLVTELGWDGKRQLRRHEMAPTLLRRDPNSLIHGVYFASLKPGNLRMTRMLSATVEASGVSPVISGGVKFDHLNPQGEADEGKGHVPFGRREYTAGQLMACFSLDLVQLRAFGLSEEAGAFLTELSWLKVQLFLRDGLRLRTACDLMLAGPLEADFELPSLDGLLSSLPKRIRKLRKSGELADPWDLA